MSGETIQGLWIGPELSKLEQLCINSFLSHGHEFHLYMYEDVMSVPPGVEKKNAGEILPSSRIFQYREHQSFAGFANFFRYKLLLERGGWWVDLDVVCLKPFVFAAEHVFSSEHRSNTDMTEAVNNGIIRAPIGSVAMKSAWEDCCQRDPATLKWGETGPLLMQQVVETLSMAKYVQPAKVFCPIPHYLWFDAFTPGRPWEFGDGTYAIHLWHEMWRRYGLNKNDTYSPNCLFERLKKAYLL